MPAMAADSEAQLKEVTRVTSSAALASLLTVVSRGGRLELRLFSLLRLERLQHDRVHSGPAPSSSP